MKSIDSINIYQPIEFEIDNQNWLFYDLFIQGIQNLLQPYMENDVVTLIRWRFPYFGGENNNSGQTTQHNTTKPYGLSIYK
jgi:hypothetical protein